MILIVGASGHLGSVLTQLLLAQGKNVRLMSRNPVALAHLQQQGIEVVQGDLRNPESLRSACQGIDQVVAAAHALNGKGDNNPRSVDDLGNRQLIDAAKESGVKHLIFISTQGASSQTEVPFLRMKNQVEVYLQKSGLAYTILRPAAYMELWGQMVGERALKQGKTMIFGKGENPINFISVENVAELVGMALDDPHARNRTIDVGGPEDLTLNQVAAIFEQLRGQPVKVGHIPISMMRLMSVLMRRVNPTLARLIQMSIYMDTQNLRFLTPETYQLFPLHQTQFKDWVQRHYASQGKAT
jgi:uncharacterized protein YbjT (DUF2867 family)